jgi:hypothetical protein
MYRAIALSGLVLALAMPPAFAASTQQEVIAACSAANATTTACRQAIASYIAATGKTGADLDKLLGELAYKLVTLPNIAPVASVVADALKEIAVKATSTTLKSTINSFAADAEDGAIASIPPKAPSATNPSGN